MSKLVAKREGENYRVGNYLVVRAGRKWSVDGKQFATLGEVKQWVAQQPKVAVVDSSELSNGSWLPRDYVGWEPSLEWDCIDPCALLIAMQSSSLNETVMFPGKDDLNRTLDAHGWLNESGEPDIDRAQREINRVRK